MKKFVLMAVLTLSALTMSAQEDSKFTFKVGVGISSFVGSDAEYEKNAFAYKVGVSYDWTLSENFSHIRESSNVPVGVHGLSLSI